MNNAAHPFDQATRLAMLDEHHYQGYIIGPAYANMVGPFGGVIAATLSMAAALHPTPRRAGCADIDACATRSAM